LSADYQNAAQSNERRLEFLRLRRVVRSSMRRTTEGQRYGDLLSGVPAYVKVDEGARASEAAIERKQSEWLKSKP
jgi:hypothetical protein